MGVSRYPTRAPWVKSLPGARLLEAEDPRKKAPHDGQKGQALLTRAHPYD